MNESASRVPTAAVVWIPPDSAWEPIQAIRRRYDRHLTRWMPHVTLLYPFRAREEFDRIEPVLYEACARVQPFDAEFREIRSFEHSARSFTMWTAPEPEASFRALYSAIQAAVPDCDDVTRYPGGFTPHLSLGQAHDSAEVAARVASIQAGWAPLRVPVGEIALIARDGEAPFAVDRIIPLG